MFSCFFTPAFQANETNESQLSKRLLYISKTLSKIFSSQMQEPFQSYILRFLDSKCHLALKLPLPSATSHANLSTARGRVSARAIAKIATYISKACAMPKAIVPKGMTWTPPRMTSHIRHRRKDCDHLQTINPQSGPPVGVRNASPLRARKRKRRSGVV